MKAAYLLLAGLPVIGGEGFASEHEAHPLTPTECASVRELLEGGVPIGPGWRMFESDFPPNSPLVTGRFCRLLTMGTGEHMEGMKVRALSDLRDFAAGALRAGGWARGRFSEKFRAEEGPGRAVFALEKGRALCQVTMLAHPVRASGGKKQAEAGGLAALPPHERAYWISVDCFKH